MDTLISTGVILLYVIGVILIGGMLITLNILVIEFALRRRRAREKISQARAAQQRQWAVPAAAGQHISSLIDLITSGKA